MPSICMARLNGVEDTLGIRLCRVPFRQCTQHPHPFHIQCPNFVSAFVLIIQIKSILPVRCLCFGVNRFFPSPNSFTVSVHSHQHSYCNSFQLLNQCQGNFYQSIFLPYSIDISTFLHYDCHLFLSSYLTMFLVRMKVQVVSHYQQVQKKFRQTPLFLWTHVCSSHTFRISTFSYAIPILIDGAVFSMRILLQEGCLHNNLKVL